VTTLRDEFRKLIDEGAPLDRSALEIARIAYPTLDPAPHLAALESLATAVRTRVTPQMGSGEIARVLASELGGETGFRGNTNDYYDPRNSFLNDVLARRVGIPITLSAVFLEVGRRAGLRLEGVGFPGHFLVRLLAPPRFVLLDPFHGGRVVGDEELRTLLSAAHGGRPPETIPPSFLERANTPAILTRMLRNLVRVYVERGEHAQALTAVDLLLVVTPDSATDVRTRGLLYDQLECFAAARDDLRRYLELAPGAPDVAEIRKRIEHLGAPAPTLH
jgi:regulator of sirC expression with transglutaminase-like and TPR domain